MKYCILLASFLFSSSAFSQFLLTESQIIEMAKEETPRNLQIEAQRQSSEAQKFAVKSMYDPKLSADYSYASSKEQPIIQFAPVFNPQKIFNLGVTQKTSLGTTFTAQAFSQQISATGDLISINSATQVGTRFGLELDIWKNFFGRLDRAQLKSVKLAEQISDLQSQIDRRSFIMDIRKIYWSLIATQLSLDLSEKLVKTANQQLKESSRKIKEGLGDRGDVARNQAQLSSRESSVLFFSYQKEVLLSQLKAQLPSLKSKEVVINGREALDIEKRSLSCIQNISNSPNINLKNSYYDEIVGLLDKQQNEELKVANSSDAMDVKLKAQYQASGVDNSHGAAFDEYTDRFRNGYVVGVAIKVPLGSDSKRQKQSHVAATRSRFEAQKKNLSLSLHAEHDKIKKAMRLLTNASRSQDMTVSSLRTSMKQTSRKFRQARVSLNTYVMEQDNLFSSELQLIETKKQILHLLLDYFKIFNQHPCPVNQVGIGAQS